MRRKISLVALFIAALITLTGCGGGAYDGMNSAVATDSWVSNSKGDYGYSPQYYGGYGDANYSESTSQYEAPGSTADASLPAQSDRKLIRTIDLSIQTLTFEKSRTSIEEYVAALGGYIEKSSMSDYDYYVLSSTNSYRSNRNADYTVRIPSEKLDTFLKKVGDVGNITRQTESTEDVTLKYLDIEARAKSLEIQQERLLALLSEAKSVDEIIQLEDRISQVTYELEAKESMLKHYDSLVTFSTVYISLNEVQHYIAPDPVTFIDRIKSGLSETFYTISEGAQDFGVWFVVNLPLIIIWLAIIALLVFLVIKLVALIRRIRSKVQTKKLAKQQAAYAAQQARAAHAKAAAEAKAANDAKASDDTKSAGKA